MLYVKIDGLLKCIKKFELQSSSTTIYIHTKDEEESLENYKCPPTSINYKHQTIVCNRHFYTKRSGVWERGIHHLNASIRSINLALTLFVTLTIASRNLATPILDTTEYKVW